MIVYKSIFLESFFSGLVFIRRQIERDKTLRCVIKGGFVLLRGGILADLPLHPVKSAVGELRPLLHTCHESFAASATTTSNTLLLASKALVHDVLGHCGEGLGQGLLDRLL